MIDVSMLVSGIVILVIGIILYIARNYVPPGASTIAKFGGIVLAIIGIVLIILSVILPLIAGYT